jgi:Domain of unknown function (DUF4386)
MIMEQQNWKGVYRVAAIAAILILAFLPVQMVVFIKWPPPFNNVEEWYALFRRNKFIGLVDMDLFLIIDYIFTALIYVALWARLRQTNPVTALLALIAQLMSTVIYFNAAGAIEMLHLSQAYYNAGNDSARDLLVAAGRMVITRWQGTAFAVSYWLGCAATILISVAMLKSKVFTPLTGWFGLVSGVLMILPPNFGTVGLVMSFLSLIPMVAWLTLVISQLLKFSKL